MRQVITLFLSHVDCTGENKGPWQQIKHELVLRLVDSCWPLGNQPYKNRNFFFNKDHKGMIISSFKNVKYLDVKVMQ